MSIIFTPTSSVIYTDTVSSVLSEHVFTPISPFQPLTLSFEFSKPMIGVYETIDTNPEVRKKMTDYYFDLIRDKWLLDEMNDVLNYFLYKDGKVSMIKNLSEYSPNNIDKDTDQIAEKKVEYIENNVFNKYDLIDVLNKFSKEINAKWVDLPKHEFFLKQVVKEYIIKQIKKKLKDSK